MDTTNEHSSATGGGASNEIDVLSHKFMVPQKGISLPHDMAKWERSQAYSDLLGFILTLNEAVKNRKIRDEFHISDTLQNCLTMLETIDRWIEEIPPVDQPQRFGNKAFRTWFAKLKEEGPDLLRAALPSDLEPAVSELFTYIVEGVGNDTRIDYGTGHEMSFVAFMCCMCKIGAFTEQDYPALGLRLFERYLNMVRRLQLTYRMEPAGSQGVWSLDDYQFLPFLWGSSQLMDHPRIKPKSFPEEDIYDGYYKDYMFLGAIKFINQVKTGPFAEHSNQLWGISGVPAWAKVNSGLIKMYKAEVLAKFPIIQHFLFGSLLTLDPSTSPVCEPPPMTQSGMRPPPTGIRPPPQLPTGIRPPPQLSMPPLTLAPSSMSPAQSGESKTTDQPPS